MGGCEAHVRHEGNAYTDRTWKPEENKPLGRPRHTREDNIQMDHEGKGWEAE
jgi:hypothetical protein